jgi:hypothetical protein
VQLEIAVYKIRCAVKRFLLGEWPSHVRVSGPLCGFEGFLVNTASIGGSEENNHQGLGEYCSTGGSEENNHQGLGGKLSSIPIPIYIGGPL